MLKSRIGLPQTQFWLQKKPFLFPAKHGGVPPGGGGVVESFVIPRKTEGWR